MERLTFIILACAAACSTAIGDIVVMRDGTVHDGKVSRNGDVISIQTPVGKIDVSASDVLRVSITSDLPATASAPAGNPPLASIGRLNVDVMDMPEMFIFTLMRCIAGMPSGSSASELRQQLEQYRAMAHDRKREVGGQWIAPDDFARRRKTYEQSLKDAADLLRNYRSAAKSADKIAAEKAAAEKAAQAKLHEAAVYWPDRLIRRILEGIELYQEGDFRGAQVLFEQARRNWPTVGAAYQGAALALLGADQPLDALADAVEFLKLCPDSREAYDLTVDAMNKTAGGDIRSGAFVEAKKLVSQYAAPSGFGTPRRQTAWLMPGTAPWISRAGALPVPPYDRIVSLQCVGVPVGKQMLLVDIAIQDAQQVFVRIDDKTLIPGRVRRISASTAKLPPLTIVTVSGYEFTPIFDKSYKPDDGAEAAVLGLGVYPQLGQAVRKATGRIASPAGGEMKISTGLLPGEAAGPVIAAGGELIGMLAGKIDPMADNGGPDRLIPLSQITALLDRAGGAGSGGCSYGYSRMNRTVATQPARGAYFVVMATLTEKMGK